MVEHHHDSLINFPLAAIIFTMPWWLHMLQEISWLAGVLVPIVAGAVAVLQLVLLIRKHIHFNK